MENTVDDIFHYVLMQGPESQLFQTNMNHGTPCETFNMAAEVKSCLGHKQPNLHFTS